ncbi:hypothetical protein ACVCL3_05160 [Rhodanobacter sp. UC4437_H4]|jgi:ankyrin repeat protein
MDPLDQSLLMDLVLAIKDGEEERVHQLLTLGVPPDRIDKSSGWSALHASVLYNTVFLPALLQRTLNPDAPTVLGGTALSYAVHELGENPSIERQRQLHDAIGLLRRSGANPKFGGPDQSALELSRLYRMPDVEQLLLQSVGGAT